MYVAVFFQDLPGTAAKRQAVVAEHRQFIKDRVHMILAAGATFTDDGKHVKGGSYMIEVPDLAEARRFFDEDPFTKAGLRANGFIQPWVKAIFDGRMNMPTDDSALSPASIT